MQSFIIWHISSGVRNISYGVFCWYIIRSVYGTLWYQCIDISSALLYINTLWHPYLLDGYAAALCRHSTGSGPSRYLSLSYLYINYMISISLSCISRIWYQMYRFKYHVRDILIYRFRYFNYHVHDMLYTILYIIFVLYKAAIYGTLYSTYMIY